MAFKVQGSADLIRKLRALPEKVAGRKLKDAVIAAAEPIRSRMEAIAPRGDPAFPNVSEIVITPVRNPEPWTAGVWIGPISKAFYAYFLEFGTKFMAARPFVRPAFDGEHAHAQQQLADDVWAIFVWALR